MVESDREYGLAQECERLTGPDPLEFKLREEPGGHLAGVVGERVVKDGSDIGFDVPLAKNWNWLAKKLGEWPSVVQAVKVIDVRVCVGDRVNKPDPLPEKLDAHFWRGINQQISLGEPEEHAGSSSLILGVG